MRSCKDNLGRKWKAERDSSIQATRDKKAELVTPILNYEDIKDLQEIVRSLRRNGAISNPEHGCGVHIHIGADGQTPQTLRNLANLMASHENLIKEALKLDESRVNTYCQMINKDFLTEINRKKPQSMSEFADIWYKKNQADWGRTRHYNPSRYHMLNFHATFTKGTIEFRLFQFDNPTAERKGGLHAGQLKTYIQLALALVNMATELKTASPKEQQKENSKFAMRTWLVRMGFVGEEFETARLILTKNLDGNNAWRFRV